ncbi:hypothetical protein ACI2K6_14370 [Microbacterium sp. NPDC006705]|uniref:hypothetical protein n=1 Tax=Microbacterium sp. NPDC006705 TaxID=3364181 RepID=UPI00384AC042
MKTVLLMNNYDMSPSLRGDLPAHHLFGCAEPPEGWAVERSPIQLHQLLGRLPFGRLTSKVMWRLLGDPIQALWAARRSRETDGVVWVCTQAIARSTLWLRALRLIKNPVVVLVHSAKAPAAQLAALRHADAVVSFSNSTLQQLKGPLAKTSALPWGPDLGWAPYARSSTVEATYDVVAFGKTHRDYTAVRKAAVELKWNARFYDGDVLYVVDQGIETQVRPRPYISGAEMVATIASSRAVVVPVSRTARVNGLTGLTELCDAVAVGVPVLMPANDELPFDIEAAAVGAWVAADATTEQYERALRAVDRCGSDGFSNLLSWWNETRFSEEVFRLFDSLESGGDR